MQLTTPVPAQDSQACTAQHAGRQPGLSGSWATAACLPTACVARQMCHLLTLHSKLVTQASNPSWLAAWPHLHACRLHRPSFMAQQADDSGQQPGVGSQATPAGTALPVLHSNTATAPPAVRACLQRSRSMDLPALQSKIRRARSELLQERPSQDPSHDEIGARLGLKGAKVAELTKIGRVQSLDAPLQVRATASRDWRHATQLDHRLDPSRAETFGDGSVCMTDVQHQSLSPDSFAERHWCCQGGCCEFAACMTLLSSRPQVESADKVHRETFLAEVLVGDANEGGLQDSERQEHIKQAINTGGPCSGCMV